MAGIRFLQRLPEELLQNVVERLERPDLQSLSQTSIWCYQVATAHLWRNVELVDCKTEHDDAYGDPEYDDHDDTPLLKKLFLLATKPWLAAHVQVLTHRCHLPPPAIFHELPRNAFSAQTLSADPRTIKLAQMAVGNMKKVHTVRIIFGHPHLTDALLRCFFDSRRATGDYARVRKLWLENCRVSAGLNPDIDYHPYGLPLRLDFTGLESIRLRRMPMRAGPLDRAGYANYTVYARDLYTEELQDGLGGRYAASTNRLSTEMRAGDDYLTWLEAQGKKTTTEFGRTDPRSLPQSMEEHPLVDIYRTAQRFDAHMYKALGKLVKLPDDVRLLGELTSQKRAEIAYRGNILDPGSLSKVPMALRHMQAEKMPCADAAMLMVHNASASLISLNLDWILSVPHLTPGNYLHCGEQRFENWIAMYHNLFRCRFPKLRAFQVRNCVVMHTTLPDGLYLLDTSTIATETPLSSRDPATGENVPFALAGLAFMEAHPELQCLSWPMTRFFSNKPSTPEVQQRVNLVLENMARNLIDLRVDTKFSEIGEPFSETDGMGNLEDRIRRKRFIAEFAPKMRNLRNIKIEGGMPRDERREVVRALHACSLEKIVTIGICSPIGNTWGEDGDEVSEHVDEMDRTNLEAEDKSAVFQLGVSKPLPPYSDFTFVPQYGWDGQPPMLHTLASYHADTIRELKFCGWKGAPLLLNPTPLTTPLLSPLKYFHKLESLIISLWLSTQFAGHPRDSEVISYWTNARSPAAQALVLISDEEPENAWDLELRTKYAPGALAWRVTNLLGPFLSPEAKSRPGGVHVRASFSIGDWGGIFDLDLHIGKGALKSDVCLGYVGPREENEETRRKEKLEGRRWF